MVRMPDLTGSTPEHVFMGLLFLHIACATLVYADFLKKSRDLVNRMLNQSTSHSKKSKEDIQQTPIRIFVL